MINNLHDLKNMDDAFTFRQLLLSLDPYDKAEIWLQKDWNILCYWKESKEKKLLIRVKRPKPLVKSTKISVLFNNIKLYDNKVCGVHIIGASQKRLAIVLYDTPEPVITGPEVIEEITREEWAAVDLDLEKYETSNIPYNVNENTILSFVLHQIEKDSANYDKVPLIIRNLPSFRRLAIQYNPKLIPVLFPAEYSKMIGKGE